MSARRERIQPEKLHVRKAGDKVLYSQVVVVELGGHRQIFIAGQTPRDRDGNCVGRGDMRAQIEQVGENIKAALEAAGATLADIVKTTTYVTDMDAYFKHQDMRMRYFFISLVASYFQISQASMRRLGSCISSGWTYLIGRRNVSAVASCWAFISVYIARCTARGISPATTRLPWPRSSATGPLPSTLASAAPCFWVVTSRP